MTKYQRIREKIEKAIVAGKKNFIIYPFGENGILTKQILNWNFCIEEKYIIDNKLAVYNQKIKNIEYFEMVDCSELTVLLTIENSDVIGQINKNIRQYFSDDNIINIFDEGGGKRLHKVYKMWKIQLWTIVRSLACKICRSIL